MRVGGTHGGRLSTPQSTIPVTAPLRLSSAASTWASFHEAAWRAPGRLRGAPAAWRAGVSAAETRLHARAAPGRARSPSHAARLLSRHRVCSEVRQCLFSALPLARWSGQQRGCSRAGRARLAGCRARHAGTWRAMHVRLPLGHAARTRNWMMPEIFCCDRPCIEQ